MNDHPEEEFQKLRELLALKRRERPSPYYFERLAASVARQIEEEEISPPRAWWQLWLAAFDARPVLACCCATAVSGLLLAGFALASQFEGEAASVRAENLWLSDAPPNSLIGSEPFAALPAMGRPANVALAGWDLPGFPSRAGRAETEPAVFTSWSRSQ